MFSFRQQQCSARLNQKESPNGKKGKTTASEQLGKGRKEITTEESSKQANQKQTSPRSSSPERKKKEAKTNTPSLLQHQTVCFTMVKKIALTDAASSGFDFMLYLDFLDDRL